MVAFLRKTGKMIEVCGETDQFYLSEDDNGNTVCIPKEEVVEFSSDVTFLPAIQWTGDNLKEVIEFTGRYDKFNLWFNSWEDYEEYVKTHGNIFKIFSGDGHWNIKPGTWIVKTLDGFNFPLGGEYERG